MRSKLDYRTFVQSSGAEARGLADKRDFRSRRVRFIGLGMESPTLRCWMGTVQRYAILLFFSLSVVGLGYKRVCFATAPEYQVKAAFLLNFMKFVEWPGTAFADEKSPLVLAVVGEDPFGVTLNALESQVVRNRAVQVKRLSGTDGIRQCHLLYVSPSEEGRLRDIVTAVGDAPVLVVSDGAERFAQQGVSINFILSDNKIRFEINVAVAKKAGLSMGTQLLQVAKVVEGG